MSDEKSIRNSIVIGGSVSNSRITNNAPTVSVAVNDAMKILDQLDAEVPKIAETYLHDVVREKIEDTRRMIQEADPPKDRIRQSVEFLAGAFKSAGLAIALASNLRTALGV